MTSTSDRNKIQMNIPDTFFFSSLHVFSPQLTISSFCAIAVVIVSILSCLYHSSSPPHVKCFHYTNTLLLENRDVRMAVVSVLPQFFLFRCFWWDSRKHTGSQLVMWCEFWCDEFFFFKSARLPWQKFKQGYWNILKKSLQWAFLCRCKMGKFKIDEDNAEET